MLTLQPRLSLEIPHGSARNLGFRRLGRPTPLPTLQQPIEQNRPIERLLSLFSLRRR